MKKYMVVFLLAAGCFAAPFTVYGQVVAVTLRLETNQVAVGSTTTLHVFGQVIPAQRANSDRIFSWNIDLLNLGTNIARFQHDALQKPASDNDPRTSSKGTFLNGNITGIYDTFLNRPGAGVESPVLLCSLPVQALASGRVVFRVARGTGTALSADFLVAPKTGGEPLTGGDYSAATIELQIGDSSGPAPRLRIAHAASGTENRLTLNFQAIAGKTHVVEFKDDLGAGNWQPLPNSPHNSGAITDTNTVPRRFYRLRVN